MKNLILDHVYPGSSPQERIQLDVVLVHPRRSKVNLPETKQVLEDMT